MIKALTGVNILQYGQPSIASDSGCSFLCSKQLKGKGTRIITFSFDCQQETVVSSPPLRLVLYFSALLIFTEAPVVSAGP